MTQLRKTNCPQCGFDLNPISNYFDEIERGIGKRGSTFSDVDGVSHDLDTNRFLFREFKQKDEALTKGQRWLLSALAPLPGCSVWFLRRLGDGLIGWAVFGTGKLEEVITEAEYQERLRRWWLNVPVTPPARSAPCGFVPPTAADIPW